MPAKLPLLDETTIHGLKAVGKRIRDHRKAMGITATAVAEAAGMSRVTLHRIENGEPAVTVGAYINAMQVLGLEMSVQLAGTESKAVTEDNRTGWIPVRIRLRDYPELQRLAWHVQGVDELTPAEALGIYERNVRHLDATVLTAKEQSLIEGLRLVLSKDHGRV